MKPSRFVCRYRARPRSCFLQRPTRRHGRHEPLRVIVPFAAGTITDIVPRLVFEQLSAQLGQSIIVENRPGAGGTTAAAVVAKADPDGYTILVNSSAHTIAPALYPNLSYDPAADFSAVALLGIMPSVLVVSRRAGSRRSADFVAAAKAKPGTLNFGSAGVGTATASQRDALSGEHRRAGGACSVQGRAGSDEGDHCRPARLLLRAGRKCVAACEGRCAHGACGEQREAVRCTPRGAHDRARRVSLMPSIRSGSACSCRQRRRAPSSTSCTARSPRPWQRRV